MDDKTTPRPWTVSNGSTGKLLGIRAARGMPVLLADMTPHLAINGIDQMANAALIVRAVNAHDALVAALSDASAYLNLLRHRYCDEPRHEAFYQEVRAESEKVRAALALAEAP